MFSEELFIGLICSSLTFFTWDKKCLGASVATGRVQECLNFPIPDLTQNTGFVFKVKASLCCQRLSSNLKNETRMSNTSHSIMCFFLSNTWKHTKTLV